MGADFVNPRGRRGSVPPQEQEKPMISQESRPAPAGDLEAQAAFFDAHSYVVLPGLLSPDLVAELNEAIDRDRRDRPSFWGCEDSRNGSSNLLLTEPVFEPVVRHPQVLPLVERLLGGPACFEELSVQLTGPSAEARPTGWHRDTGHWMEHPRHLDYPQIIYYLTDVEEGGHHFTVSPEPAGGDVLGQEAQLARGGVVPFYGRAGSGILFNAATLHGATIARTERPRRILQIYYGHPSRPPLSQVSLTPARLWRDHPDADVRRFYGKLNRATEDMRRWMGAA
jgi:ectoine hydroxylase-related dioxygenase (phytanoyl-CoA dioxygenase family)